MRSSKTRIWWVIAALVLLLAAAAVWFFCSYSVSDGRLIARKADVIDLRGEDISAQEAEALAAKYPDKTVLWDVPLSGGSRPSSAESLSLSSLSADDIPLFACFPNLKSIDASGCADYEALLALRSAYPALDLTAFVTVGGKAEIEFNWDADSGRRFEGTISSISYLSEKQSDGAASQSAQYVAYVDFTPDETVRIGMTVIVYVE